MLLAKRASLLISVFLSSQVWASEATSSLQVVQTINHGKFFAGGEVASLQSPNESLSGFGMQVGYQYLLSSRLSFDGSLSQIYGKGITALYSGIVVSARWAPFKEFALNRTEILFEGKGVYEERPSTSNVFAIGVQFNQLFLNGVTSVYNATGIGFVASYETRFWERQVRPEVRFAQMTANDASLNGIFMNLVLLF
jgi:hypothetical protein